MHYIYNILQAKAGQCDPRLLPPQSQQVEAAVMPKQVTRGFKENMRTALQVETEIRLLAAIHVSNEPLPQLLAHI